MGSFLAVSTPLAPQAHTVVSVLLSFLGRLPSFAHPLFPSWCKGSASTGGWARRWGGARKGRGVGRSSGGRCY